MGGVKKILRVVAGYTLIVLGVAGLFLPILQGTLMIIAGAALLGWDMTFLKRYKASFSAWWRKTFTREG